jgi:hypothetical protein
MATLHDLLKQFRVRNILLAAQLKEIYGIETTEVVGRQVDEHNEGSARVVDSDRSNHQGDGSTKRTSEVPKGADADGRCGTSEII